MRDAQILRRIKVAKDRFALIERVGATMDASEKIIVHYADFDLFTGLSWLHSLRDMQLNTRGTCSPYGAGGW